MSTAPRQPLPAVREDAAAGPSTGAASLMPAGGADTGVTAWLHEHVGRPVEELLSAGIERLDQVGDEVGRELGAQLDRLTDLWNGWWRDGGTGHGDPGQASADAMPALSPDIRAAIGWRLADRDRASLALANRDWHAALSPDLVLPRMQAALAQADTLERFGAAMGELQARLDDGWAVDLPAAERARLADLLQSAVERTGTLPLQTRPPARQLVWQALEAAPAPWGDAAMAALLARINDLPPDQQLAEFHRGAAAIQRLEPARRGPALAAWWPSLRLLGDPGLRARLVEHGFAQVAELPELQRPRPLAALLGQIRLLPEAVRKQVYHQGFETVMQLPPSLQSEPLAALYSQLQQVRMTLDELGAEHRRGLQAILALDVQDRHPLGVLIGEIATYPF
jgi:hypothetical protein